jgi:hypothetical protein
METPSRRRSYRGSRLDWWSAGQTMLQGTELCQEKSPLDHNPSPVQAGPGRAPQAPDRLGFAVGREELWGARGFANCALGSFLRSVSDPVYPALGDRGASFRFRPLLVGSLVLRLNTPRFPEVARPMPKCGTGAGSGWSVPQRKSLERQHLQRRPPRRCLLPFLARVIPGRSPCNLRARPNRLK